jgi:Single-stranded DNA-binding protein
VAFGKTAENCEKYLTKGSKVAVAGKLAINKREKDGIKKESPQIIVNSVIFLSSKSEQSTEEEPF